MVGDARDAPATAAIDQPGADHQPRAGLQHGDDVFEQALLRRCRQVLQYVEDGDAAPVRRQGMGQVGELESCGRQSRLRCRTLGAPDLRGIVVDAVVAQRLAVVAQGMREQAESAAEVEYRRAAAAQGLQHARIQRVAGELAAHVVVVPAVERIARQVGACDVQRLFAWQRWRVAVHGASNPRAIGNAMRTHSAYIAAEGCRPSSASISISAPRSRLIGVMSTKAMPSCMQSPHAMVL